MIVHSFVVPGLSDEYKTLQVKLAEFLNTVGVFWDPALPLGKFISLEGCCRILLFENLFLNFLKISFLNKIQ